MKCILCVLLLCFFFMREAAAIDLSSMTIEKYEQIEQIRQQSDIPLIAAVQKGDIEQVQTLLEQGVDINIRDGAENTALLEAVKKQHIDILKLLLARGADPNVHALELTYSISYSQGNQKVEFYQHKGNTPLSLAILTNQPDIVELLVKSGADTNLRLEQGMTALSLAAKAKAVKSVKILLEHGADTSVKDKLGWGVLIHALSELDEAASAKILMDIIESTKNAPNMQMDFLSLDEEKIKQEEEKNKQEFLQMADLLIAYGADVNAKELPLMYFSEYPNAEAVKFLLEHGAEVNLQDENGKTALMHAAGNVETDAKTQIVKMLLDKGAKANMRDKSGETALDMAARAEDGLPSLKLILAHLNSNDLATQGGKSLWNAYVFASAISGNSQNLDFLLEQGIDVNYHHDQGFTVLIEAVGENDIATVQKLLKKGADVNLKTTNFWGGTALMKAAENGNEEIVRLLLEHGADVNVLDNYKEAALVYAVKKGHENIVALLLKHGARVTGKGFYRKTVLDYAKENKNQRIIDLLQSHGAV